MFMVEELIIPSFVRLLSPSSSHIASFSVILLVVFPALIFASSPLLPAAVLCQQGEPASGRRAPRRPAQQRPPPRDAHPRLPGGPWLPDDDDPRATVVLPELAAGSRLLHTGTGRARRHRMHTHTNCNSSIQTGAARWIIISWKSLFIYVKVELFLFYFFFIDPLHTE